MTSSAEFRAANAFDLADIQRLLAAAALPFEDIDSCLLDDFVVLYRDGSLIAAGGIERFGEDGLLRSIVVDGSLRGSGLGIETVKELERRARKRDVRALYLLTTTAAEFFPRLGYERFDRAAVPDAISKSKEFTSICPASAVCMRKLLEVENPIRAGG